MIKIVNKYFTSQDDTYNIRFFSVEIYILHAGLLTWSNRQIIVSLPSLFFMPFPNHQNRRDEIYEDCGGKND